MTLASLLDAYQNSNVTAFLRLLREGESNQTDDAYRLMYGGKLFDVTDGWKHPTERTYEKFDGEFIKNGKLDYTTAAGAYQITETTWNGLVKRFGFSEFSPRIQDLAAVALIVGRGALADLQAGRLYAAIRRLPQEWTSLAIPKRQEEAKQVFLQYGGTLAEATTTATQPLTVNPIATPQVKPMGIFAALLPTIIQLIPQLASVFKPGSEVAQRNVAAATIVTQAISDATQAVNLQDAVEKMQNDPAALAAAQKAVNDVWPSLIDSGPAVTEARKAAASSEQTPPWKNPAVWVTFLFVPLIYGAAWAVLYREGASDDLKTMVVTAIFAGLLGSITGFFLGSSLGSQRKDALIGK